MAQSAEEISQLAGALARSLSRQSDLGASVVPCAAEDIVEAYRAARHSAVQRRMEAQGPGPTADDVRSGSAFEAITDDSGAPDPGVLPPWSRRSRSTARAVLPAAGMRSEDEGEGTSAVVETLASIREDLGPCTRCPLCEGRQNIVFGAGPAEARLMFIGEGPGADEDAAGEPFVGKAGKLLDRMINAMGLERDQVYIANIVKCRPPNNRDPEREEVASCLPFLKRQIRAVRPEVIVTLGRVASQVLLETDERMGQLRGNWQSCNGIPVMPTWHPAYLLRTPDEKRSAWMDLQAVMQKLEMGSPRG